MKRRVRQSAVAKEYTMYKRGSINDSIYENPAIGSVDKRLRVVCSMVSTKVLSTKSAIAFIATAAHDIVGQFAIAIDLPLHENSHLMLVAIRPSGLYFRWVLVGESLHLLASNCCCCWRRGCYGCRFSPSLMASSRHPRILWRCERTMVMLRNLVE